VIGTLAVDGWTITFGTARRGLDGGHRHTLVYPNSPCIAITLIHLRTPALRIGTHFLLTLRPVYSDATQLNWPTSRWLAVRCNWVSCIADLGNSWVVFCGVSIVTQLNSTRRRVELSCVAINGPLETTVFLFHLLSTTSKPFSSLSTRLAHAARLGFFYKKRAL